MLYILLVGAAARLILLFGSPLPILEGDASRTRFDGRLVNQGINPYEFRPEHLMDGNPADQNLNGERLERLLRARAALSASTDAPRPEELRRPDLRSTATPLQIWISALADRFKPASTRGYAYFVLLADALAMFLLVLALRRAGLPPGWLIVYAWCPVLLREAYVTLAVDAFLLPAIAAIVYGIAAGKKLFLAIPIALAASLRLPLLLLNIVHARRMGLLGFLLVFGLCSLPFLPLVPSKVPVASYAEGQVHLWRHYEYNSLGENLLRGMFRYLPTKAENSLSLAGVSVVAPDERLDVLLAKVLAALIMLGVATYLLIRVPAYALSADTDRREGFTELFIALVAILLLGPMLTPAQSLWLLPLLVVRPAGISWLMLPALVSTSYLTHLAGPDAADLTLLDGKLSFRLFEYGAFALLLLLDLLWREVLLPMPESAQPGRALPAVEEDLAVDILDHEQAEAEASLRF
ncbi:MAG: hypothetical protein HC813_00105 [Planctomycetes bacterium]|nr:hypothetical protein [Planctomycetota bacterium]